MGPLVDSVTGDINPQATRPNAVLYVADSPAHAEELSQSIKARHQHPTDCAGQAPEPVKPEAAETARPAAEPDPAHPASNVQLPVDVYVTDYIEPPLKLGDINAKFGGVLTISADGMAKLGFEPLPGTKGPAKQYAASEWPAIKAALLKHIEAAG
jgi:hypothetical protein